MVIFQMRLNCTRNVDDLISIYILYNYLISNLTIYKQGLKNLPQVNKKN